MMRFIGLLIGLKKLKRMKAKIINANHWYSNKQGIVVQIKDCDFLHLWLAKDITTDMWRQILKSDVELIEEIEIKKP